MKPTPIHILISRLKPLGLAQQIFHLQALVRLEPERSVRGKELQQLLAERMTKQIKRENREQVA